MLALPLKKGFALGYGEYRLRGFEGAPVRVAHDLLQSVVFFGHGEGEDFKACGTGFFLLHKTLLYLVTAKHLAEGLGDDPFNIRVNSNSGGGHGLFPIDLEVSEEKRLKWFGHPEASVDLAILPFPVDVARLNIEAVAIGSIAVVEQKNPMEDAGCGDMCHVIGLFSFRTGRNRNIPVVHTGHIAALSDSKELIPTSFKMGELAHVEGHLVEIANLQGLSGAPVFVRGGKEFDVPLEAGDSMVLSSYTNTLKLLGVWQGSWDVNLVHPGQRVPIGMGVVTPAYRLIQLLDSQPVEENRRLWLIELSAATPD